MVKRTKTSVKASEPTVEEMPAQAPVSESPVQQEPPTESVPEETTRPKKRTRRQVDFSEMMTSYRSRMTNTDLTPLANTWLTDFNLHQMDLTSSPPVHHAKVLLELCKERKIPVRGVVSCNKKNNAYVQRLPDNLLRSDEGGTEEITYIGSANKFTNLEASPFAPVRDDAVKVIPPAPRASAIV